MVLVKIFKIKKIMHLVECFSYSSLYAHQRVKISLYSPDIVVIADF